MAKIKTKRVKEVEAKRLKTCPRCKKKHNLPGRYCSPSCANVRDYTPEMKEARKKKLEEFHDTPEGQGMRDQARRACETMNAGGDFIILSPDEFGVVPPDIRTLEDYSEFFEDFQKGENW